MVNLSRFLGSCFFSHHWRKVCSQLIRKKSNIVPVHKKNKILIKNYPPISLLPIFREIYERLKAHSQVWDYFWQIKAFLKTMKNAFYFTSKALFVFKIFNFLSWPCSKTAWLKKTRLISKIMMSQPCQQTIVIHILPNMRSNNIQVMKFGQLINYNMRIIFIRKMIHKIWWRN